MENEVLDKSTAESLVNEIVDLDKKIEAAVWALWNGRGWIALGFSSWGDMCDARFNSTFIRIPMERRQEVVCSLAEKGMGIKSIVDAGIAARNTVRNDLRKAEQGGQFDPPAAVTGADGKTYTRQERLEPSAEAHEATAQQEANTADFRKLMNTRGESPEQKHAREHKFYDDLHKVTRLLADLSTRASDEPSLPDNITYFIESARQSLDNITAVKDGVTITDDQIMAELLGGNNA